MNQRLVESVAQIILAMSAEERELLESLLQRSNDSPQTNQPTEEEKSLSVVEIAQDIRTFEETYNAGQLTEGQDPHAQNGESVDAEPTEGSPLKNSFLRIAQSLKLEGPEDLSINIDHYLYGLPKQDV